MGDLEKRIALLEREGMLQASANLVNMYLLTMLWRKEAARDPQGTRAEIDATIEQLRRNELALKAPLHADPVEGGFVSADVVDRLDAFFQRVFYR